MAPKPDVSEERKQQILDAAINVFSRDGFHEARMDDIAQEAEMSKGALYWYFNSKDELISNILGVFFDREFERVKAWDVENRSARSLLESYSELLIDDLVKIKPFFAIVYEFLAMVTRNKHVKKVIQKSLNQYIELTVPLFQKGVDEGEFKEMDANEAALAFGALIEGSLLLWAYDMEQFDFAELITRNVKIFLDGIEK
jgi:AcrR family transcriptional regulator